MPMTLETDPGVLRLQLHRAELQLVEKDKEIERLESKLRVMALELHDATLKLRQLEQDA